MGLSRDSPVLSVRVQASCDHWRPWGVYGVSAVADSTVNGRGGEYYWRVNPIITGALGHLVLRILN